VGRKQYQGVKYKYNGEMDLKGGNDTSDSAMENQGEGDNAE
jgi:hypothetical protein